ncbi:MAG: hypothetical protein CL910_22110 [Deltaproteobacteria bacterium]|nr:hypothetical protein [Deltaproteobacteria bacterium]
MFARGVVVVLVTLVAFTAQAADSGLSAALDELAVAADEEKNLSPEFKEALNGLIGALRETQAAAPGNPSVSAPSDSFFEKLHPFADFRLRYEHRRNRPGRDDRNRSRIRFRIGAEYDLHPELRAGFRLRTGDPNDPNSPHRTLGGRHSDGGGGMFDSFEIALVRAYLKYKPSWFEGSTIWAGKFDHPFVKNPVYGELVWDDDVNPEGVAGVYKWSDGNGLDLRFAAGEYFLVESGGADEASMTVLQGAAGLGITDDLKAQVAVGWYRYANLNADGSLVSIADNGGCPGCNALDASGEYASGFRVLNPIASLTYSGLAVPITLSGEFILNTSADSSRDDDGYAVGVAAGKVSGPGDWKVWYQFQNISREALFSGFAQDDFLMATNYSGHVAAVDYGLAKGISLRAWGLVSRPIDRLGGRFDDDEVQVRVDLNAKF